MSAQLTANRLSSEVRARDPAWRPGAGISSDTIEGAIGRANAVAREAQMRLLELGGPTSGRSMNEIMRAGNSELGWRAYGAAQDVRTLDRSSFDRVSGELLWGAREVSPPRNYDGVWFRRYDGEFGIRLSRDHGPTIDLPRNQTDFGFGKVHRQ